MTVFRIAKKKFISDLSGEGARLYGGRWNQKGSSVLYTSESRSLATVEYLVHLPISVLPSDVCIAEIEIQEIASTQTVEIADLPKYWMNYPAPMELMEIGEEWKRIGTSLVLKVPSVVVKNEWNYLINPIHPSFQNVKVVSIEEYIFDQRLMRKNSEI